MKKSFKLTLKPIWDEIEIVRKKSSEFLESQGLSKDSAQAFTMVISELVENSIKYGHFGPNNSQVLVDIQFSPNSVIAEVSNPIGRKDANNLKILDKTIQWIRGFQNPLEAYTERLKEVSKKPLNDENSGLGLVRIAYEGKAILDFFVSENSMLNVSALAYS